MVVPSAGELVLVPFPFFDLSSSKLRPAVCLANAGRGDWILCQVTSKAYGDSRAQKLDPSDVAVGGLRFTSFARPGKLFTAHESLIVRSVAKLTDPAFQRVLSAVIDILKPSP